MRVSASFQIIPRPVGRLGLRLGSGPHVVGRLGSGMGVSASFQLCCYHTFPQRSYTIRSYLLLFFYIYLVTNKTCSIFCLVETDLER